MPGQYSIVTELMPNGSIADLLKKKGDSVSFLQRYQKTTTERKREERKEIGGKKNKMVDDD